MKKILFALCGIAFAFTLAACSSDDGEGNNGNNENGGNSGNNTDYIATQNLKQRSFTNTASYNNFTYSDAYRYYRQELEGNIIYEDFNVRYRLATEAGEFRLKYYQRENGQFNILNGYISEKAGIIQLLDISSIKDITDSYKSNILTNSSVHSWKSGGINRYSMAYAPFQPGCGYVIMLTTETGEEVYIRMYATNYTLDSEGSLETVTLEYQLF